jgi:hypothetical protein
MIEMVNTFKLITLLTVHTNSMFTSTAYIDPNTGGMLFQILAVLFGVISGLFLVFSGRIKNLFYKIRRRMSKSSPEVEQQDEQGIPSQDNK